MIRRFILTAMVAVAAALTAPTVSEAAFTLTVSDGSIPAATFSSSNAIGSASGFDSTFTVAGQTTYLKSFSFDGYFVSFRGTTNNPGGSIGMLTDSSFTVTGAGTGASPLVLDAASTGFTGPGPLPSGILTNMLSASLLTAGSLSATSTITPGGTTAAAVLATASTKTTAAVVPIASPYDLSNQVTITGLTAGQSTSFTLTSTVAAPAPAGLVMAVTALPFVGFLRRRLKKCEAVTAA